MAAELEGELLRLRNALSADCGDRPALADEGGYFRLVERAARDPDAAPLLHEVGGHFAACFVSPYLHAQDLPGVLAELGDLLAIHHRARLHIDEADATRARIVLTTMGPHGDGTPTPFDIAILDTALLARFPHVEIRAIPLGAAGGGAARNCFEIRVDASGAPRR